MANLQTVACESAAAAELATALAEYEVILDTPAPALATLEYSIRIPHHHGRRRCATCSGVFRAAGPTGFAGEIPICDLCLFRGDPQLGMIIALIAVSRNFARSPKSIFETFFQALLELGAFARLYETFAARYGPPRPFELPGRPGSPASETEP